MREVAVAVAAAVVAAVTGAGRTAGGACGILGGEILPLAIVKTTPPPSRCVIALSSEAPFLSKNFTFCFLF